MQKNLQIRPAKTEDAEQISYLCGQLGYPAVTTSLYKRLSLILPLNNHRVFVMTEDNAVVGWIHAAIVITVEYDPAVEIMGLIVDESHRKKGIAKALIGQVVQWASEGDYPRVRVRSNLSRVESHIMYNNLGFVEIKKQAVYDLPASNYRFLTTDS